VWYRTRYRRTSSALTATAFILSDLLGVLLSFGWGFFWVNIYDFSIINFKSFVTYWPYLPVFILIFWIMNLYPGVSLAPAEELRRFTIGSYMAFGGIIMSRFIEDKDWDIITAALIVGCLFSTFILLTMRTITHRLIYALRLKGIPAVIYGSGSIGRRAVDSLLDSGKTGYAPVLILDDEPEGIDEYRGIPVIHNTCMGPEIVKQYHIKMAIIALSEPKKHELERLLNNSASAFRYNVLVPDYFGITNIWMSIRDFDGILGFATSHRLNMIWNRGAKRFLDLCVVILGGIIVMPVLLFTVLLIKIGSPGPALYTHTRLGINGKKIKVYKFRSMVMNADEKLKSLLESDPKLKKEWEQNYKLKNDPRVTRLGKFMRRTSLDEFPQIINVLKGEMSLVGPRPVTKQEVAYYGENFKRIFSVKPGITGLWQVSGRSDTDYAERVSYDTYYQQSWSIWLDLWVLYKTIGVVLRGKGAY
jgi:Undecaprenyl-phosphate galactose phosphotransferase WbaP